MIPSLLTTASADVAQVHMVAPFARLHVSHSS
jgi:hypothetical protein